MLFALMRDIYTSAKLEQLPLQNVIRGVKNRNVMAIDQRVQGAKKEKNQTKKSTGRFRV